MIVNVCLSCLVFVSSIAFLVYGGLDTGLPFLANSASLIFFCWILDLYLGI